MAADLQSGDSSGDELTAISAINVTPFVDVVLVLLVIFMVTAPILSKDVFNIHLPKAASGEPKTLENLGIAVTEQGQLLLNGQLISPESLIENARAMVAKNSEVQALISADGNAHHSDVIRAIDLIKTAGVNHFAIQIEKP